MLSIFKGLIVMPILPMVAVFGSVYYVDKAGYPDLAHATLYFGALLIFIAIHLRDD